MTEAQGRPATSATAATLKTILNAALTLYAGLPSLNEREELRETLEALLSRLYVAHLLANKWVVAVGGAQGVGKTSLLSRLYDLDAKGPEWLPATQGRGEKRPVLIQEVAGITVPRGMVWQLQHEQSGFGPAQVVSVTVEPEIFRDALKGVDPSVLLPVLQVPQCHFHDSAALLLLPGYEPQDDDEEDGNAAWQELMRQALVGAGACLIVTDEGGMANDMNGKILADLKDRVASTRPVIAISKLDTTPPDRHGELQCRAATLFGIDVADTGRVICTGSGEAFVAQWRPALIAALQGTANSEAGTREERAKQLRRLLKDLAALLHQVIPALKVRLREQVDASSTPAVQYLETYRTAAEKLKRDYEKQLRQVLNKQRGLAWERLQEVLGDEHEGLINAIKGLLDTTSQKALKLETDVITAFTSAGDVAAQENEVLRGVTFEALGSKGGAQQSSPGIGSLSARIGYDGAVGAALVWDKLPDTVGTDLALLLHGGLEVPSENVMEHMKLLPALALEFGRVARIMVPCLPSGEAAVAHPPAGASDPMQLVRTTAANFEELAKIKGSIVSTLGKVLLVGGSGLEINSLADLAQALLPAKAAAAGAVAAQLAAAAGLAAGLVVIAEMTLRATDRDRRVHANNLLIAIRDAQLTNYLEAFDKVITQVYDKLENSLQRRYGFKGDFIRLERVALAVAQLHSARLDLEGLLLPSGPIKY